MGIVTTSSNDYFITITEAKNCIGYISAVTDAENLYLLLHYRY